MTTWKAAILYRHPLFDAGIACRPKTEERLRVVQVDDRQPGARERIRQFHPDVVVEAHADDPAVLNLLQEAPGALVVCMELDDNTDESWLDDLDGRLEAATNRWRAGCCSA